MRGFVVDTNVAIVANGKNTHADAQCQLQCIRKLRDIVNQDVVVIDDSDLILREYKGYLSFSGSPGVGDLFFKHILNHQYQKKVLRVAVTESSDPDKGFEVLPPNTFDPADRKFLAVAVVSGATVLNATDSDWTQHSILMAKVGVCVEELCPQHIK